VIIPVPATIPPADRLGRVHFVGIGGAGLSGIARIMLARGLSVSGSDAKESRALESLRALGAQCFVGHDAVHVRDADTLVVSTAVRADNPEVVETERQRLRLLPRSAALESVMQGRRVVAVAGTHGKTTTTSLLTVALQHCAADPSFAIGGELNESGSNAHDGSGDIFVAEADESDGAFLVYSPFGALVTNVEADHLETTEPRRPTTRPSPRSSTGSPPTGSWSSVSMTRVPLISPSRRAPRASPWSVWASRSPQTFARSR